MAIRIITDTSSDLSYAEAYNRGIHMVSMTINVDDASYADGIDLSRSDFYDMLLSDTIVPKTSQPTPGDFLPYFEQAKANGDDIIAIVISGALSGTLQSAQTAKDLCGYNRIHIVDSRCASAGVQFLIFEAQRMALEGASIKEIIDRLESVKHRIRIYLGLDTLKYLYRGGRLSRIEAGIGTLANLRPLLCLKDGGLDVAAKCIGSKKAIKKLSEIIASYRRDPAFPMAFIYSYDSTNCRALMDFFPASGKGEPLEIGPTLSAHAGTGVYGAIFVEAE